MRCFTWKLQFASNILSMIVGSWLEIYCVPWKNEITYFVGNKPKGRISKRVFQESKTRQIFRKTNNSYTLIRTGTCLRCFVTTFANHALKKYFFALQILQSRTQLFIQMPQRLRKKNISLPCFILEFELPQYSYLLLVNSFDFILCSLSCQSNIYTPIPDIKKPSVNCFLSFSCIIRLGN